MNLRFLPLLTLAGIAASIASAAESSETSSSKGKMKQVLNERITQEAKAPAKKSDPTKAQPAQPATPTTAEAKSQSTAQAEAANTPSDPVVLPQMEVRRERIREIDLEIAKQNKAIAREKQLVKSSEVDRAINDDKVAKKLSIFGGVSAQTRQEIASERVQLMEAERDILEALKHTKTEKEKNELEKQLNELRAMRRDLDRLTR